MAEILGNKLKINSIDIIPSTINHNDEYLKVSSDETKYEYVSNEEIKNELDISYNKFKRFQLCKSPRNGLFLSFCQDREDAD